MGRRGSTRRLVAITESFYFKIDEVYLWKFIVVVTGSFEFKTSHRSVGPTCQDLLPPPSCRLRISPKLFYLIGAEPLNFI
jgi:hypothetical protein